MGPCRSRSARVAFANAAKIALINLDEPLTGRLSSNWRGEDRTAPAKEIGSRLAVDAGQVCGALSCHPSDKKLRQSILRLFLQTTTAYPHSLILDPLRIWDSQILYSVNNNIRVPSFILSGAPVIQSIMLNSLKLLEVAATLWLPEVPTLAPAVGDSCG
jgi:hypothetical protein